MTRRCELTGKLPMSGQLRSHAENKTKRTFRPNLCEVTLISDQLQRKVRLRISAHALKTVERRGGLVRQQLTQWRAFAELARVVRRTRLHIGSLAVALLDLLVWLQDANWPISRSVARFLVSIGEPMYPFVREVFAGTDGIWKYWCVELFVRGLPRAAAEAFRPDLQRLAFHPTADDRSDEVDERARDALAWLDGKQGAESASRPV